MTFFDDDFAGRIAQKQLQTSRALTDVAAEVINVVFFALASLIGSAFLLTTIDWRIAVALGVWLIGYFLLISWFIPKIRARSKERANARAMVTGQVVDTITNIKTVKLFAHADYEEGAALDAIKEFRERALDWGVVAAMFRFTLMALAGCLPVLLIGGTLWLWSAGIASAGDIAAAGAVSIRRESIATTRLVEWGVRGARVLRPGSAPVWIRPTADPEPASAPIRASSMRATRPAAPIGRSTSTTPRTFPSESVTTSSWWPTSTIFSTGRPATIFNGTSEPPGSASRGASSGRAVISWR